jgi:ABC-type multidrug transport system fused ATPase/permease subunit
MLMPETLLESSDPATPTLVFDDVHFAYEPEKPVLRGITLEVQAGESVALIGASGAGKTTLLQLIPRFLDPDAGTVRIQGIPLGEFNVSELRRRVALVLQEPVLLPASLAENIGYGRAGASFEAIQEAAKAANAHNFISRLPNGYRTVVGDGAVRLSVGEKQRIDLARAFLKDAPILLLDEPTSALDAESEALVLASLRRLKEGRITLMVAHRLQTILNADKVAVLEQGKLCEFDSPTVLAGQGGYFARMTQSSAT